jgi:hypothetical protein
MMNPNISTATCYKIKSLDEMNSEYKHFFDRDHKQQQQHQMQVVKRLSSFVVVVAIDVHDGSCFFVAILLSVATIVVFVVVGVVVSVVAGNKAGLVQVILCKPLTQRSVLNLLTVANSTKLKLFV